MDVAKETSCTHCVHSHVCKYKVDYLEIVASCDTFSTDTANMRNDILEAVSANAWCKFYARREKE